MTLMMLLVGLSLLISAGIALTSSASTSSTTYSYAATPNIPSILGSQQVPIKAGIVYTTSLNWAGYVVTSKINPVTELRGSWIVPSVNCASTPNAASASWIGTDGFQSSTMEQVGTASVCSGGVASYYGWYDLFPQMLSQSQFSNPVHAGDVMWARVQHRTPSAKFTFQLNDVTEGWTVSASGFVMCGSVKCNAVDNSAEWITEALSSCPTVQTCQIQPLANFGSILYGRYYTGVGLTSKAIIGGHTMPITKFIGLAGYTVYNVEMDNCVVACGVTTTTSSPITAGGTVVGGTGTSFSTTWVSS
jgi:hypothetical protein